ncbi:CGNR zinc finger domain-containing protein [Streptomyces sp. 7-21]|nr:CGNR zinc finger domain-containing protein [Streptomyces sp. 7-21]MBL1066453.1 CGNR zinc finger domain-containing protein [Streptomyces sp. 7-21]
MFVDRSRRGVRRWCDMGSCGNRATAAGFPRVPPLPAGPERGAAGNGGTRASAQPMVRPWAARTGATGWK